MGKIDIDKFVASVMKCLCKPHREEAYLCKHWITEALDAQGLMFKDGKIVEVEGGEETFDDEKIRKRLLTDFSVLGREEWGGLKVKDICAWLEKQEGCEQKNKINSYKITFEDVLALECSMKTAKITEGGDKLYEILVPLYNKIHNAYLAEKQGELPEGCVRKQVAEAKEALYTAEVDSEDKKMINALLEGFKYHQLFHPMFGGVPETEIIAWLEKQKDTNVLIQEASEKAYTEGMRVERKRWLEKQGKKKSIDDLTAQEAMDIAVEKCFEGGEKDPCEECSCAMLNCTHFPCDKKKEFDGEKPYSFKSIPRLLEMIEPSDRAKAYCKKLINSLNGEGYTADAKVVGECLKMMNGEKVAMATMDMEVEGKKYCKVKPKFKVGDFILNGDVTDDGKKEIFKIRNVCSDWYNVENIYDSRPSILTFTQEWSCRLWNISDAKDGDVLANDHHILILKELVYDWSSNGIPYSVKAYCGIKPNGNFEIGKDNWCFCGTLHIHPATKEQRDTLFAKMKENGYRWDADKKELEKIEDKPTWTEEDEKFFKAALWHISYSITNGENTDCKCDTTEWLKHLKERIKGG